MLPESLYAKIVPEPLNVHPPDIEIPLNVFCKA